MGDDGDDALTLQYCAWCNSPAMACAATCATCGAAIAQQDDLAGVSLPGVTVVEPLLAAIAERRHRFDGAVLERRVGAGVAGQNALAEDTPGAVALQDAGHPVPPIRRRRLAGREQHPLHRRLVDGSTVNSDNIGRD
jgi:hypothetical protein